MNTEETPLDHHEKLLLFLESFRKSLGMIILLVVVMSGGGYYFADDIIRYLKHSNAIELASYGIAETFFTFLMIAVAFGLFTAFPFIIFRLLYSMTAIYHAFSRKMMLLFCSAAIVLFYTGAFFCMEVALKYGIGFLLSFGTETLKPIISVKKYISFCLMFIFAFGGIFELPLGMALLSRLGILKAAALSRYRRYAVLAVAVGAAVLTPTPDVFNMMLMAIPLYMLFEIGLLSMRLVAKK